MQGGLPFLDRNQAKIAASPSSSLGVLAMNFQSSILSIQFPYGRKTHAVQGAGSQGLDGLPMGGRAVAFIFFEPITREFLGLVPHPAVPMGFCQDGGCGNRQGASITFGQAGLG